MAQLLSGGAVGSGANVDTANQNYHIFVYGKYADPLFQKYRVAACFLAKDRPNIKTTVEGFFETQYERQHRYLVSKYGGSFSQSKSSSALIFAETDDSILFFVNEERFMQWAMKRFHYEDNTRLIFYKRVGQKARNKVKASTGRSYCSLSLQIGDEMKEMVHLELFDEYCPILARNFLELLKNANFNGHRVHRVKAGAWVQAGDLVDSSGKNSQAANGELLRHESFQISHDRAGLLGMSNHGKDTNGSQFYITLRELPFLDGKSVIIGRVINGMRPIYKANKLATRNERPLQDVKIFAEHELTVLGSCAKAS